MASIQKLNQKLKLQESAKEKARNGREAQIKLFEKTKKEGHRKQATKLGREMISRQKAINKLNRLIDKEKAKLPRSGAGSWGGSKSIIVNEVAPVAVKHGAPKTSAKRGVKHWATIANPGSDHSVLALTAFAQDYATFDGEQLAKDIAKALRITGYSTGNYNNYYITRNGRSFRVQILWAVEGHYDHVHVGIRRA